MQPIDNYQNLLSSIFQLKRHSQWAKLALNPKKQPSPSTSFTYADSIIISDIPMRNSCLGSGEEDPINSGTDLQALQILVEIDDLLGKYESMSGNLSKCMDHLANFLENFQLLGDEIEAEYKSRSLPKILVQSSQYCMQHISNAINELTETILSPRSQSSFRIGSQIQQIFETLERILKSSSSSKNSQTSFDSKTELGDRQKVEELSKIISEYQKQRLSFIVRNKIIQRLQEYYEKQLEMKASVKTEQNRRQVKRRNEWCEPQLQFEDEDEDEDEANLPTFNYSNSFSRKNEKQPEQQDCMYYHEHSYKSSMRKYQRY